MKRTVFEDPTFSCLGQIAQRLITYILKNRERLIPALFNRKTSETKYLKLII